MYDELVKKLRSHNGWALNETLDEAADAIGELVSNADQFKWISVKDALPKEERKTYWVYTNDGIQHECRWTNNRFGLGESDKWGWSVFDIPQYTIVTHWMPLPEPPKEDADDSD